MIYSNPFNPKTTINFSMRTAEKVNLSVYNINGQKIKTLYNKLAKVGNTSVSFNGSKFASGIYFVKMSTASGVVRSKKMILIK